MNAAVQRLPMQPDMMGGTEWMEVRDGNLNALALFTRHYTNRHGSNHPGRFAGPGEKMVLITACARALFVWRVEKYRQDDQQGVNCAVFRNEGAGKSSELIWLADALADVRWPGQRHYTYVNSRSVRSTNPGFCFIAAGWNRCGVTKRRKLHILEKVCA